MIHLQAVSRSFDAGATFAVRAFELEIAAGEFVVLLGESGSGKTTTLRLINRLLEPTAGAIRFDGRDIADADPVQLRRSIGYVIQRVGLFPHFTVAENIRIVPQLLDWPAPAIAERVDELLQLVRLVPDTFRDRMPDGLSGGQAQRVGVARALAARPRIMLMDEPFGALDPVTRAALQDEYRRIHESLGLTTVMVTHDVTEALLLADRVVVMRAGLVLRVGSPAQLLRDPGHDYVRELIETPRRQSERLRQLAGEGA